jgi:hypothetical protein
LSTNNALQWESAGTDDPGDQNAESQLGPHAYWSIGPTFDSAWSVELIQRDDDLQEIGGLTLQRQPTEQDAKAAAQAAERLLDVR